MTTKLFGSSKLFALISGLILLLPLCTVARATPLSADGTVIYGGGNATITTSAGTWQLIASSGTTSEWPIYFNGSLYANGYGNALVYENGQIFTLNNANQLWYANGTGWSAETSVSQNGLQVTQVSTACPQTATGTASACSAYIVNALNPITLASSPFSLSDQTNFKAPLGTCSAGRSLSAGEICSTTLQFAPSTVGTLSTTISMNMTTGTGPSTSLSGVAIQGAAVSAPSVTLLMLFGLMGFALLKQSRKNA